MPRTVRAGDLDLYLGGMIRARRRLAGVTQGELARAAGVCFQQIQKYERGTDRVAASTLARIATRLGAPVAAFYPAEDPADPGLGDAARLAGADGGLQLARVFLALDPVRRKALLGVAGALQDGDDVDDGEQPDVAHVHGDGEERHVA